MKKDTDKLITKPNNFLGLLLFTIIYFLIQNIIYPLLGLLFWFSFMLIFGGIVDALGILKVKGSEVIFTYIFYCICLAILFGFMYYLGYLCKEFLGKINKIGLNIVMIVILIYFLYKTVAGDQNSIIDALIDEKKYIFCTILYISYIMGAFHSDKVKKILDRIKFKRKNK